jgi:asparagine N-glycosylation enzyme membrane subunit Stt3
VVNWTNAVYWLSGWRIRFAAIAMLAWAIAFQSSAWAQEKLPLIKRLDGPTRAKVLAALAGLVILGFGMVMLAWLGARVTRRYMKGTSYFRPTPRPQSSDWSPQPLRPGDKLADEPGEESGT